MSSDLLSGAGFPAVEGWYTSIAAPHLVEDTKAAEFIAAFKRRFNDSPDDYTITAYDASLVIIDSVKRVAASGKPVTREAVRDAIQTAKVPTIQGVVSFDENGDLADRTVSVFQIKKDATKPLTDVPAQYKYLGRGTAVLTTARGPGKRCCPGPRIVLQARRLHSVCSRPTIKQGDFNMVTRRVAGLACIAVVAAAMAGTAGSCRRQGGEDRHRPLAHRGRCRRRDPHPERHHDGDRRRQ